MKEIKGKSILVRVSESMIGSGLYVQFCPFFLQATNPTMDFNYYNFESFSVQASTTSLTAYPIGRVIFDHTAETKCQSRIPFPIAFLVLLFIFSHHLYTYQRQRIVSLASIIS